MADDGAAGSASALAESPVGSATGSAALRSNGCSFDGALAANAEDGAVAGDEDGRGEAATGAFPPTALPRRLPRGLA
ncbi:hypothetical protein ACNJU9_21430, partial [Mycobacterium tuberculosis]